MKKQNNNEQIVLIDEQHSLPRKNGNGILRYFLTSDEFGKVKRYSLAYINHNFFTGDNGRVLGYDNDHGYHHRHYFGVVEPVTSNNYEEILNRFEQEWRAIHEKSK